MNTVIITLHLLYFEKAATITHFLIFLYCGCEPSKHFILEHLVYSEIMSKMFCKLTDQGTEHSHIS